jgi:hypothetical protein
LPEGRRAIKMNIRRKIATRKDGCGNKTYELREKISFELRSFKCRWSDTKYLAPELKNQ